MDLITFLDSLYQALTTYIIPLILFTATVAFLTNVVRYFIIQGGSEDGREKARRYMVWSLIGFVLTIALWGIISLLLAMFGFNFNGTVCPDYDPFCISGSPATGSVPAPGAFPAGGGGSGGGSPSPVTGGTTLPGTIAPGGGGSGGGSVPTTVPGTVYSSVGTAVQNNLIARLCNTNTFLSDQLATISNSGVPDTSRLRIAISFERAGLITQAELTQIQTQINQVRQGSGLPSVNPNTVGVSQQYINDIRIMFTEFNNSQASIQLHHTAQGATTAQAPALACSDLSGVFNTQLPFQTRINNAQTIYNNMGNTSTLRRDRTLVDIVTALNVETFYLNGPTVQTCTITGTTPCP